MRKDNVMKRILFLFLLLAAAAVTACAQEERAPSALFESAQCLVADPHHWVDVANTKQLALAYLPESKSFHGGKYLYVIVWDSSKHEQGTIYDVRLKDEERHRVYSIENNAQFRINQDEVTFLEPPLGGQFRQNQLTNTIHQIMRHHKWYEAQVKQLIKPSPKLRCETNVEDVAPVKDASAPAAPAQTK